MRPRRSSLGIGLQLTDVLEHRTVGGTDFTSSVADARDVLGFAQYAEEYFSTLYLTDNLGYRSSQALLPALATGTRSLGLTMFTAFPFGRSPIDVAPYLATVQELLGDRHLRFGISRGGGLVNRLYQPARPLRLLEQYVVALRALLRGESVRLADLPELVACFGLNPEAEVTLRFEPRYVPVLVASTGPKGLQLAGRCADGVQFVSQQPSQSRAVLNRPDFAAVSALAEADAAIPAEARRTFHRQYGISVCLADDPADAITFAKRQIAGILSTKTAQQLTVAGIDPDLGARVRHMAIVQGNLEEASKLVPDAVVQQLVLTGDPEQLALGIERTVEESRQQGFDEHFLCFPLGPDLRRSLELLTEKVLPRIGNVS